MAQARTPRLKEYVGYVWIGDDPGIRVSIWATDAADAGRRLRAEHGSGHQYSIRNLEDAQRPRSAPSRPPGSSSAGRDRREGDVVGQAEGADAVDLADSPQLDPT